MSGLNIYNGLNSGSPLGYASAAVNAGGLYNNLYGAANGSAIPGIGPLGAALGVYSGLKQGGLAGYAGAATSGLSLASGLASMGALGGGAAATSLSALAPYLGPIGLMALPFLAMAGPDTTNNSNFTNRVLSGLRDTPTPGQSWSLTDPTKQATYAESLMALGTMTGKQPTQAQIGQMMDRYINPLVLNNGPTVQTGAGGYRGKNMAGSSGN